MSEGEVTTPDEGSSARPNVDDAPIETPMRLHSVTVPADWVDYNGHMSESCYLLAFGDNADAFFRYIGIDDQYRADGHSLYTVETHLHHRREAAEGALLVLTLRLLDVDDKRVHLFHEMFLGDSETLVATAEQLLVHVDMVAGRSAPMPPELLDRVRQIKRAHESLPIPSVVGRPMRIARSTQE
jgi:acyl-CoA thioester hydrolase